MKINYYIIFTILLAGILVLSGCVQPEKETIKIGVVAPMSGDLAMYGQSTIAALQYASANFGNEIDGKKIEFIAEDGGCNGESATKAFNKLVNVDKVYYVIGGFCSGETMAGASIVNDANVISLSNASSSPAVRDAGNYVFSMYPLDDFSSQFDAEYIYNTLGIRKVAILYGQNDWGKGKMEFFKNSFEKLGGEVVIVETNEHGATNFKIQLTKIDKTDAELIYIIDYTDLLGNLFKQVRELNLSQIMFVPEQMTPNVVRDNSNILENVYGSRLQSVLTDQNFESEIKSRSGLTTVDLTYSSIAYDGLFMLKQAIENVGDNSTKVRDELLSMEYSGIAGMHKFDKDGVPAVANYKIEKVINGQLVEQE